MSRRTHTTEVGSILCTDLDEIGAGKEHWLVTDPQILCALDTHSIALAKRSLILILNWAVGYDRPALKIRPDLSPIGAECVSALEWLGFDEYKVVLVGTSRGYLLIFSVEGDLIHKQLVYSGRVLKVRVRGFKKDSTRDTLSVEVSVVLSGVIARFDGSDIKSMLDRWFQESHSQFWDRKGELEDLGNSYGRLPYQLWNVSKFGACTVDAAITGIMPPPLLEVQSSQCYYCAISVGEDAVISAYRLSEDRNRSLVGAILSKVVPAAYSTISSFSKLIWRSEESSTKRPEEKPQPFAQAAPLTCLKDHPRKGEKLTLSPSGSLAAITDSLGRVLLLDTQAMVVVRLWKGYRDACCLFMEMMVKKNAAASDFDHHEAVKSDYCLCLAIHAPRKGIIEVWQMRTGPRLLSIQCPKGCKMLQPAYRSGSTDFPYVPLEVFLLNGDSGQLSVLNRSLN